VSAHRKPTEQAVYLLQQNAPLAALGGHTSLRCDLWIGCDFDRTGTSLTGMSGLEMVVN
jgi:hypothetical protein